MTQGRRSPRALLAADAFLFAGALDLAGVALVAGVITLVDTDMSGLEAALGPVWGNALSLLVGGLLLLSGAFAAWRMHGRRLDTVIVASLVGGSLAGAAIVVSLLTTTARLLSMLLGFLPSTPQPWFTAALLALTALAVLALPAIDAIRDLDPRRRRHVVLDKVRIAALLLCAVLAVVVLPWAGAVQKSEVGEAGLLVVPFAIAAALGVAFADYVQSRLKK